FQNSHKPDDLWHFTTPDYSKINLWLQLQSGDNKQMAKVVKATEKYLKEHAPPFKIKYDWAGLTYINLVWQDKMVGGMLKNFLASFIIVFFMMTFLFRSPLRGLISMVPLTVTILFIYSLLGFIGKRYDMPVAVLSALTLGLSIDFAIHFIQRAQEIYVKEGNWPETALKLFAGPSRAITRNALVIAIGFLPLLFAPLVPYKTVGFFMFCIMLVSSIATLIIIPAIITLVPKIVFETKEVKMICVCKYCVIISVAISIALMYIARGYNLASWGISAFITIGVIAIMSGLCSKLSKHKTCIKDKKRHFAE
ncbi:MAG: MMPL family transporter, partial [Candidatus Omnitrophica bacterium]|nr:MMPL family transporter [Candidatus Omnitrophota bacterium]